METVSTPLGGVSLLTLNSIAYSALVSFTLVRTQHNVAWQEVIAVAATDKAKYWIYIFTALIEQVEGRIIDRDTANLYVDVFASL